MKHYITEKDHYEYGPTIYGISGNLRGIPLAEPMEKIWKELLTFFRANRFIFFDSQGDLVFCNSKGLYDAPTPEEEREFLRNYGKRESL